MTEEIKLKYSVALAFLVLLQKILSPKNKNKKHKTREILVFEESSTCSSWTLINKSPYFTLGVKANAQLKSSIPLGEEVEISPKQGLLH
jgi:hypothetical protein